MPTKSLGASFVNFGPAKRRPDCVGEDAHMPKHMKAEPTNPGGDLDVTQINERCA